MSTCFFHFLRVLCNSSLQFRQDFALAAKSVKIRFSCEESGTLPKANLKCAGFRYSPATLTVMCSQPIKIAFDWLSCPSNWKGQDLRFHAVCAVNAQTCLNCNGFMYLIGNGSDTFPVTPYFACACTAVIATTPTMSSAEHPLDRSLTGAAIPWHTGP